MLYKTFHYTCRGAKHIKDDTPCQDSSDSYTYKSGFAIAAVSDGHGSEKHFRSEYGSKIACKISRKVLQKFFKELKKDNMDNGSFNHKLLLRQLSLGILKEWQDCVYKHFKNNGLTERERSIYDKYYSGQKKDISKIYGATFVLAVISDEMSFVVQTGDSLCLVFDNYYNCTIPHEIINPDCMMGFTTSLSDSEAINNFRYYWPEETPKAIFVCSDGVVDSYSKEDLLKFGTVLLQELEKDHENALCYVKDWLPKLSEKGSGDDMSIAGIYKTTGEQNLVSEDEISEAAHC